MSKYEPQIGSEFSLEEGSLAEREPRHHHGHHHGHWHERWHRHFHAHMHRHCGHHAQRHDDAQGHDAKEAK